MINLSALSDISALIRIIICEECHDIKYGIYFDMHCENV